MRQMRQRADGGLYSLSQKTQDIGEGTEMDMTPEAFRVNQFNALVLPLVSDRNRLIWVRSNQVNLQMDDAAELEKAFDTFPYLTQHQTASLAQRCSLHPDQVRVWFMAQRLRYGISWDYNDILEVQWKFKASWENEVQQNDIEENDEPEKEEEEFRRKMREEVWEKQSANEGRMMRANEQHEPPMEGEEEKKVEKLKEEKRNTQKKRKQKRVTDKIGKRSRVAEGEEVKTESTGTLSTTRIKAKTNHCSTPVKSSSEEMEAKLEEEPELTLMKSVSISGVGKVKEAVKGTNNSAHSGACTRTRLATKTRDQLVMMKAAFTRCQYPDAEGYSQLAILVGLPRPTLVQWYGDMRYYVKKLKPCWLTKEQHKEVLANIRYRQCLNSLAKSQLKEKNGNQTWEQKLEKSESSSKNESVTVPPE